MKKFSDSYPDEGRLVIIFEGKTVDPKTGETLFEHDVQIATIRKDKDSTYWAHEETGLFYLIDPSLDNFYWEYCPE